MSETITLEQIKARRAKITKPPWKAYHRVSPRKAHQQWHIGNESGLCQITMGGVKRDYEFIASAPTDIDYLIERVTELEAALKAVVDCYGMGQPPEVFVKQVAGYMDDARAVLPQTDLQGGD